MNDDQNNKNTPIDETEEYLSRFDAIYDRIESEGAEDASAAGGESSHVSVGRVSRLNEKKKTKLPFTSRRAKEERKAAREERKTLREKKEEPKPAFDEKPVGFDEPVPEKTPKFSAPLSASHTEEPAREPVATEEKPAAEKDGRSFGEKFSDGAAEVVAALVVAHRRVHAKPEKTVKRVDRKTLREEEKQREEARAAAKRIDEEDAARLATSATVVLGAEEFTREQARIDREKDMPETTDSKKKKQKTVKYKKNGKPKRHIFLKIIAVLIALGILCGIGVCIWVATIVKDTPDINPDNLYDMLSENTVIYDSDGEVLEYIYDQAVGLRTNLSYNEIPKNLVNAFVAIEDKTFFKHHGFNFVRIIGAIVNSLKTGDEISGTSTITQQLARNLYLKETQYQHSYVRKIQEAYYTIILERALSKEQIIEAYLNTIYLGQNSYGIYAASQTYFNKTVDQLNLAECALLASIPKSPRSYAPFTTISNEKISDPSTLDIIYSDTLYTVVYQANYRNRFEQVLKNMEDYGMIDHETREEAKAYDLRAAIQPSREKTTVLSSYFADYVQSQVKADLMNEYNITAEEASKMLRTGGLRIYSTIDTRIQKIADDAFADPANFPTLVNMDKDKDGNILNKDGAITLFYEKTFFDADGNFTLKPSEYEWLDNGNMKIFRGNRMNIYRVTSNGETTVQLEFKYLYSDDDGSFFQTNGGVINIPSTYMSRDDDGNLILARGFFSDSKYTDLFVKQEDGSYKISPKLYSLRQKTIQPQAAMVITDYHTGEIKCMVGGRTDGGKLLYNRALSTRQPGSSIKPLTVYGAALQRSYDLVQANAVGNNKIFTAATVLDDSPTINAIGEIWPKNSYNSYRGLCSLRKSVEQSINVNAVRVQKAIGNNVSITYAQKFGIDSFVTDESKGANDMNPSALALGGMVNGVTALKMASAYGAYPNGGLYQEPICYTKVTNKMGDVLLEKKSKASQACDEGVAFIMTDILRTTVSNGIAGAAAIDGQPVGGKTGTTTDRFDIWFDGFTPYYSASLWIGNDTNIELSTSSSGASKLWSKIMNAVHEGYEKGSYPTKPSNVTTATIDTQSGLLPSELTLLDPRGATTRSEYFLVGTVPSSYDESHVYVDICTESGFLATDACRAAGCVATVLRVKHPADSNLIYTGRKLSDEFCIPFGYSYGGFSYPGSVNVGYEITRTTTFNSIKYSLPKSVIDDIYQRYGSVVTYKVGDYDYAAPVYYCYLHNNNPLGAFPIDPNVITSPSYSVPDHIRRAVDPSYEGYTGSEEGLDVDPSGEEMPDWIRQMLEEENGGGTGTSSDGGNAEAAPAN